jgi:outer membrane protein OmpA-like peptidoglycan-associated protein
MNSLLAYCLAWCFRRSVFGLAVLFFVFLTESYGYAVNGYRVFSGNSALCDSTKAMQNKLGVSQTMISQLPSALKGDIQVFRVDGNGAEYPLTCLKVEETTAKQLYPILPIIFFDKNSDSLPRRYKRFVKVEEYFDGIIDFRCRFYNTSMMSAYYDVLNVIGKRLKDKPSSKIILTGCNDGLPDSEKSNKKLSMHRAITVRNYLMNTWDVDSTRIKLEARDLPVYATTSVDTLESAEENRRVEITSNDPSVLEPLQIFDTLSVCSVPKIRVRMKGEAEAGFEMSLMRVYQSSRILKEVRMSSAPLAVFDWNVKEEPFTIPRQEGDLDFDLELYDKAKQKAVETYRLSVEQLNLTKKKELKIKDKTVDVFRLISFPFNSAQMGKLNEEVMKKYVNPYLSKESKVVATGYADKLETSDKNQRLSDRRAKSVANALKAGQVTSLGVGNRRPLYTNDQPEGRFYNRTVEVRVETPVDYGK